MKTAVSAFLVPTFILGCGEDAQQSQPPRSPAEVIRECVESSGKKLDEALKANEVGSAVREIVQLLDDHEDYKEINPYEEFHRGVEELEGLATKGASNDELKSKIDKLKQLASKALASEQN